MERPCIVWTLVQTQNSTHEAELHLQTLHGLAHGTVQAGAESTLWHGSKSIDMGGHSSSCTVHLLRHKAIHGVPMRVMVQEVVTLEVAAQLSLKHIVWHLDMR